MSNLCVGDVIPLLRDVSSEGTGYLSARAGESINVLHIGKDGDELGWIYAERLPQPRKSAEAPSANKSQSGSYPQTYDGDTCEGYSYYRALSPSSTSMLPTEPHMHASASGGVGVSAGEPLQASAPRSDVSPIATSMNGTAFLSTEGGPYQGMASNERRGNAHGYSYTKHHIGGMSIHADHADSVAVNQADHPEILVDAAVKGAATVAALSHPANDLDSCSNAMRFDVDSVVLVPEPVKVIDDGGYLNISTPRTRITVLYDGSIETDDKEWIYAKGPGDKEGWIEKRRVRLLSEEAVTALQSPHGSSIAAEANVSKAAVGGGGAQSQVELAHAAVVPEALTPAELLQNLPPPPRRRPPSALPIADLEILTFGLEFLEPVLRENCYGDAAWKKVPEEDLRQALMRAREPHVNVIIDARPFDDPEARSLTKHSGMHPDIIARIVQHQRFGKWLHDLKSNVTWALEEANKKVQSKMPLLRVAIYCKAGRHRSVAGAIILRHILHAEGWQCNRPLRHLSQKDWPKGMCKGNCDACRSPTGEKLETRNTALNDALEKWRNTRL
eukprot:TRINITY_DN45556_c0_g1_i1.p1 TRINITY_DN45556_c0_g1~~TRINITY_DN45556_c0_g1_i1.p1  ORF type:complete len:558 (-),score=101.37 TRINITY_DN45556_c0_g1_i1:107-1780(-)